MECREFRSNILDFLKEESSEKETKKMLQHISRCPDCKEELKIQYMVWEGRKRLVTGGNFDLQKDFEIKLARMKETNDTIRLQQKIVTGIFVLCVFLAVLFLVKGLLY